MRLDVDMLAFENASGALPGDLFDHVHVLTATVVAFARVALGILVGKDRSSGCQDCISDEVFGGYQLQVVCDAVLFAGNPSGDFRIDFGKRPVDFTGHPRLSLLEAVSGSSLQVILEVVPGNYDVG